jgi:hypothetical protein
LYIENYIAKVEDVLRHPAFDDTRRGYTAYIDVGSFVDYLLLNEWANNVDGFIASLYLHKDRASVNHHIVAGPVWDFNIAFGNANYSEGERTIGWRSHYGRVPFWWRRMLQDTTFTARIGQRWRELRETALSDTRVVQVIDSLAAHTAEAQQRHFTRWKLLGVNIWPNAFVGQNFEEEIAYLKTWSLDRMSWMDGNIHTIGLPREDATVSAVPDKKMPESLVMAVHPLPAKDRVAVTLQLPRALTGVLSIRDVLGREVRREVVSSSDAGVFHASFHLRELPDGLYHLVLSDAALAPLHQSWKLSSAIQRRRGRQGQARDGHAERRAADVVEADVVAELDGRGFAAVLAADAELDVGTRLAALLDGVLHQESDTCLVDGLEGIAR